MSLFEVVKAGADILKKANKIDEYQAILELLDDLLIKSNQIHELNSEVESLKNKLKIRNEYKYKNQSYWHKDTNDGPFCPRCFDSDFKLIRIFKLDPEDIYDECPDCTKQFNVTGRSAGGEARSAMQEYTNSLNPY